MSDKELYFCKVTFFGVVDEKIHEDFTFAIASDEAAAEAIAVNNLVRGYNAKQQFQVTDFKAKAISRDLLERAATQVLGWQKPNDDNSHLSDQSGEEGQR